MASDPMTLAEFERGLDASKTYNSDGYAIVATKHLRPLVLRLLAGERKRCAITLDSNAAFAHQLGNSLRGNE